jgi:hypothetical protein
MADQDVPPTKVPTSYDTTATEVSIPKSPAAYDAKPKEEAPVVKSPAAYDAPAPQETQPPKSPAIYDVEGGQ